MLLGEKSATKETREERRKRNEMRALRRYQVPTGRGVTALRLWKTI